MRCGCCYFSLLWAWEELMSLWIISPVFYMHFYNVSSTNAVTIVHLLNEQCTWINSHFSTIFIDRRHGFYFVLIQWCFCSCRYTQLMFAMLVHTHTKVTHVQKCACLTQNYLCFLFHFPLLKRTSVFNKVKHVWLTGKSRTACALRFSLQLIYSAY